MFQLLKKTKEKSMWAVGMAQKGNQVLEPL